MGMSYLGGRQGSSLPRIEGLRSPAGRPHEHEGAPANAAGRGADDAQAEASGDGGVHCVAALSEDVPPDPGAASVIGGHGAVPRGNDLRPLPRRPRRQPEEEEEQRDGDDRPQDPPNCAASRNGMYQIRRERGDRGRESYEPWSRRRELEESGGSREITILNCHSRLFIPPATLVEPNGHLFH